jgi:hypothetical protein
VHYDINQWYEVPGRQTHVSANTVFLDIRSCETDLKTAEFCGLRAGKYPSAKLLKLGNEERNILSGECRSIYFSG